MSTLSIEDIKRRLMQRGFEEDELDALFKSEDDLRKFYYDTVMRARKIGNDMTLADDKEDQQYTLSKEEQSEYSELKAAEDKRKKAKKKSVQQIKKAVAPENAKAEKQFEEAGKHLGVDAGDKKDLKRLLAQLDLETED